MSFGDSWTDDDDADLRQLWLQGETDYVIAEIMSRTPHAVASRRGVMGLTNSHNAQVATLTTAVFPRFENVTKAECRKITATTPPSGKFSRTPSTSGMTCTSILMVES